MGLFQKLLETYDAMESQVGKLVEGKEPLAPVGYIVTNGKIEITINKNGEFIDAAIIQDKIPVYKNGELIDEKKVDRKILIPCTEASASRTSGACAHPLCDNISYVTEYNPEKHESYIQELQKWANSSFSNSKVEAVLKYIEKGTVLQDLTDYGLIERDELGKIKNEKDIVTWRVIGLGEESGAVHEDEKTFSDYRKYYLSTLKPETNICMITGKKTQITHSHLKGVVNLYGNAKIISANDTSNFTYRGRFANDAEACSIGYEESQKAHNTLKWLLQNDGITIGTRKMICWCPQGVSLPLIANPLCVMDDSEKKVDMTQYRKTLERILNGYKSALPKNAFTTIAFFDAATAGRLAITYYNELLASDFVDRLAYWDTTCCWDHSRWGIQSPSLYEIAVCAYGTQREMNEIVKLHVEEKLLAKIMQRLISCRVDQIQFPKDITMRLFYRASNLQGYAPFIREDILFTACAAIRKYIKDQRKEDISMSLEKNRQDRSYQFGRLLAILENAERITYKENEKRDPNAIRLQAAFVKRPLTTAETLITRLKTGYFPKLSIGSKKYYEKLIGEIFEIINSFDAEAINRPLEETYLLGYYLQRNDLYTKKTTNNDDNLAENIEDNNETNR